jgi:hypothetical protein
MLQLASACRRMGRVGAALEGDSSPGPSLTFFLRRFAAPGGDCSVAFVRIKHVGRVMQARWHYSRLGVIMSM